MDKMHPTVEKIRDLGVVLVVRAKGDENTMKGIAAMIEGGVKAIEITFSVPNAIAVIKAVKDRFGADVLLGAGTVLNPSDAAGAVGAGAEYVVSPNTNPEVIGIAKRLGVPVMPGAFTPTEVVSAWSAGADVVKIFPASVGGPSYIKALKGPLPHIPMMPTGGVNDQTAGPFIEAGAFALGAGSNLFDKKLLAAEDYAGLTKLAQSFMKGIGEARAKLAAK
jgi:2-dehydro-3-deoxyphosphogluconate aldolase / (4S)-4-hydroxy-2-oxoglutarate aldolase